MTEEPAEYAFTHPGARLALATAATRNIVPAFGGGILGCERWRIFMLVLSEMTVSGLCSVKLEDAYYRASMDAGRVDRAVNWLVNVKLLCGSRDKWSLGSGSIILQGHGYPGGPIPIGVLRACSSSGAVSPNLPQPDYSLFGEVQLFDPDSRLASVAWGCWCVLWDWTCRVMDMECVHQRSLNALSLLILACFVGYERPVHIVDVSTVLGMWFGFEKECVRRTMRELEQLGVVKRTTKGNFASTLYTLSK